MSTFKTIIVVTMLQYAFVASDVFLMNLRLRLQASDPSAPRGRLSHLGPSSREVDVGRQCVGSCD